MVLWDINKEGVMNDCSLDKEKIEKKCLLVNSRLSDCGSFDVKECDE